jgi:hypothetical protein
VRIVSLFLLLCLAACNRSGQSNDAVRQGVLDHLTQAGLNMAGMDVTLNSVQFNGNQADAAVSIAAKGSKAAQGMQMRYHLEQKDNKWVVVGRQDSGQHGAGGMAPGAVNPGAVNPGGAMPGGASPHGGGAAGAPAGGGKMPSPEDLPPATKKQ